MNRERGEFTLTAGATTYTLRLTTNAIAEVEDLTNGRTWDQVMSGIQRGSVKDVRLLLWASFRERHPDIATMNVTSLRAIGDIVDASGGLGGIFEQIKAFLALNAPETPPEEAGRPPGAEPAEAGPPAGAADGTGDASTLTPALPA